MRASAPNYELVLSGAYVENVWGEFVLRIEPKSGPRVRVSIDTDSRAWEYRADGAPAEGSNLDADAIACFFEAAQIDTDSTSIELEIGQIVDVLDLILAVGPEDAERQKWGLPDSFMKHPVYRQQPVSTLPAMSRMSRYSKNDNVTATFETKEWDTPVDLSADVQYTHGENNRPKLLTALTIRVHNEIGWPLEIQSHPPTQSWTASMNNEQWATGSLPVSELEVLELLRRQGIAAGILEAADLVADVAALVNVDDSQLIELTNWAPPTDWKRPTEGLAAGIGNSSVSVIASRSFSQYVQFVVLVGLAVVVWIAGLWCIHRRRRSLLRLSDAAPV